MSGVIPNGVVSVTVPNSVGGIPTRLRFPTRVNVLNISFTLNGQVAGGQTWFVNVTKNKVVNGAFFDADFMEDLTSPTVTDDVVSPIVEIPRMGTFTDGDDNTLTLDLSQMDTDEWLDIYLWRDDNAGPATQSATVVFAYEGATNLD